MKKRWHIQDTSSKSVQKKLLSLRGISHDQIEAFFDPQLSDLADPFLFHDMKKAIGRIRDAIENSERIVIFGDYDVDGVTATAILVRTLLKIGADVSYRIPHRVDDGYGLKDYFVDELASKGVSLIITVDNGVSCVSEIQHAAEKGIDVIVTDHHSIPKTIPPAYAIIHPGREDDVYPFKNLSGSGVAFVFACGILYEFLGHEGTAFALDMLDLAALGTIADCVPLLGENRVIVKHGLEKLRQNPNPGLRHVMDIAGVDPHTVTTHSIDYMIAPRLNAGGRMNTALDALHLLLFPEEKSKDYAEKLHILNTERQKETEKILKEAQQQVDTDQQGIIVVQGPWHIGIIGIVAARLAEKYNRPTIVLGEKDDVYVASCRSGEMINMVEVLRLFDSYFSHYGGHAAAAGFVIDRKLYDIFKKELQEHPEVLQMMSEYDPVLYIDTAVTPSDIHWELYDIIQSLEPYGMDNRKPIFVLKAMHVRDVKYVGKQKNHMKLLLEKEEMNFEGMVFSYADKDVFVKTGDIIDIAFHLEKNEFRGNRKLNFIVQDIREAEEFHVGK